ncbi:MAG: hypothetical protein A2599_00670 [Candidatus Staskawiczbacteria bacterium RIFOXYD1_FULL_39_28]|uniref:Response regulatory domain-containing protein n=1 Tax=Candidatus Staskawiczbacteria bacterium RIFOXYC1_FULL_38_18 TaxID=1802229 RepID=A0A1G2JD99_9BACT|nr:MAG: hypothetical protein A2401_02555 [Candidatus Staskawiczbacteria bacterium RIFOXYC1_FULL_38_18]OGZ90667.1 MAG: hypothetical protein A2599_00670 [Candidatus Staskawiczbacteria bacterium RIFOXYD1_FULL_39_28]
METKNTKKRIILVEDDPAITDVYGVAFKNSNMSLEVINSGEQAIQKIKESSENGEGAPDLILLDLILPDINGIEVLKAIKVDEKTKGIKVFVLSNQTSLNLSQSETIKPDKYIIKADITPTQLVKMVEEEIK